MSLTSYRGSCHCGRVPFTAAIDLAGGANRCNCSVCTKTAWTAAIVKPEAFALAGGDDALSAYEWGGKISTRYFCRHCGIHCFARGHLVELGGDYVSVNLNCVEDVDLVGVAMHYWDGRHDNWDAGPRSTPWPIVG